MAGGSMLQMRTQELLQMKQWIAAFRARDINECELVTKLVAIGYHRCAAANYAASIVSPAGG